MAQWHPRVRADLKEDESLYSGGESADPVLRIEGLLSAAVIYIYHDICRIVCNTPYSCR